MPVSASGAPILLSALDAPYSQSFDSLAGSGTSNTLPGGWALSESGTNANTTYAADGGTNNAGNTYSYGSTGQTERAFGGLQSGSLIPSIGACFSNASGGTITSIDIAYTGEEWRLGTAGRSDRLDFQYSTDATSLTTGTWTDVDALDYSTTDTTGSAGARDGNAAAFRTAVAATVASLNITDGATFFVRWTISMRPAQTTGLPSTISRSLPTGSTAARRR